jgi:hypothetical protein
MHRVFSKLVLAGGMLLSVVNVIFTPTHLIE